MCARFKYDETNEISFRWNVYSGIIDRFKWQEKLILYVVIINCCPRLFVQIRISVEVLNMVDVKFKYWRENYRSTREKNMKNFGKENE